MWADTAYRELKDWLRTALGWRLSIPQHWWIGGIWMRVGAESPTRPSGFQVLACRWVVERPIARFTTNRRLAMGLPATQRAGSMGMRLIEGMARSLNGTLTIEGNRRTRIAVRFPVKLGS